jgi:hypothetical protein
LETAPGIGPIRAARLVPIVVTPHRFRTKRQFWSYCGLGIVTRSSSDWVQAADRGWIRARVPQTRGLSRQFNHVLKDIFKGAATLVITQRSTAGDPPLWKEGNSWGVSGSAVSCRAVSSRSDNVRSDKSHM